MTKRTKVLVLLLLVVVLGVGGVFAVLFLGDSSPTLPPAPMIVPQPMAPVETPAAPIDGAPLAPDAMAPVVPAPEAAAPPVDTKRAECEDTLREHAVKGGADPDAYVSANQAWIDQCVGAAAQ